MRWCNNGVMCIASSQDGLHPMKRTERYSASQRKRVAVQMPNLIRQCNQNMGSVDRVDENIAHYRIGIYEKKWYISILSYLFNLCVNNAWLFSR